MGQSKRIWEEIQEQFLSDFALQQDVWNWVVLEPIKLYEENKALKAENEELKRKIVLHEKTT